MRLTFIFFALIAGLRCYSQNLIANGSFEDVNICSEFNAPCSPAAWKTTSPIVCGYGGDKANHIGWITVFNTSVKSVRQYLQTELLCPLIKDKVYKFSIKVKFDLVVINSLGALFSDTAYFYDNNILIKRTPSIDFSSELSSIRKQKRKAWIEINIDYRANGDEKYLIIGNFQSDAEQKRTFLTKPGSFANFSCAIDDVEIIPKERIELCADYKITLEKLYSLHQRHTITKNNMFGNSNKLIEVGHGNDYIDTLRLSSVYFEFNSSKIDSTGRLKIDSLFNTIKKESIDFIKIFGYTDSIGENDYNVELSFKRANAIKEVLLVHNLSNFVTEVKGFGDSFPIATNSDETGRRKNRRVEVIIKYRTTK